MAILRWTLLLAALAASAQEAAPFASASRDPWLPQAEWVVRGDRLEDPEDGFRRASVQLRLRWSLDLDGLHLEAGSRSALGSDGNRLNPPRWDQQPSNGTQLDVARGEFTWVSERAFATASLGFQQNHLLASEAIWDRDLRLLGAGGRLGFRSGGGLVQEAGIRGVAGRVRTILGGRVDLAAAQAVLKLDTGAWSWTAHLGRWVLDWDPGVERLRRLPGHDPLARQEMTLDAAGAAVTWHARLPVELHWFGTRNPATDDSSEEVQAVIGSRARRYWPQLILTWQRLSATGVLYPVNGDEWWFYRRARGPRVDLALPLPGRWVASLTLLRQTADGETYAVRRQMVVLTRRF